MTRMVFKARIDDLCHILLCSQPFRDLHGILLGTVHTDAQSLDSPQHQPAVKRRKPCSGGFDQEPELLADIGASGHQKTCQCIVVTAEIFGTAVYYNVGAQIQRIL